MLLVGKITRPHGITGEVKVQTPAEYIVALKDLKRVYLRFSSTDPDLRPFKIRSYRVHQDSVLLKFFKVVSRNDSEALRGAEVLIDLADLPKLPPGEYYSHELVGMAVRLANGAAVGAVQEVLATGSNDVYIIRKTDGRELLLPAIESVIRKIDLVSQVMTVAIPEGLEDEDTDTSADAEATTENNS